MAEKQLKTQNSKVKTVSAKSKISKKVEVKKEATNVSTVKKAEAVKSVSKKEKVNATVSVKPGSLKIDMVDMAGKAAGSIELPKELFGAKINSVLMAQAVRVYLANQRMGTAFTKSRGEVTLTKAKWYRQKGTGRARHGAQSAPIFVGGGVAHGPKPRDYSLSLSKNMRQAALASALSTKVSSGDVAVIAGFEKVEKTSAAAKALSYMGYSKKGSMLLVLPEHNEKLFKATRNLVGMHVMPASLLNTYEVLQAKKIVLMKETVDVLGSKKENK